MKVDTYLCRLVIYTFFILRYFNNCAVVGVSMVDISIIYALLAISSRVFFEFSQTNIEVKSEKVIIDN
jgi:hypothetical protein